MALCRCFYYCMSYVFMQDFSWLFLPDKSTVILQSVKQKRLRSFLKMSKDMSGECSSADKPFLTTKLWSPKAVFVREHWVGQSCVLCSVCFLAGSNIPVNLLSPHSMPNSSMLSSVHRVNLPAVVVTASPHVALPLVPQRATAPSGKTSSFLLYDTVLCTDYNILGRCIKLSHVKNS